MKNDILYKLITPVNTGIPGCWEGNTNHYDEVLGYSVLGHVFLRSPKTNEYAVMHPFKQAMKQYGSFESTKDFQENILEDEEFIGYALEPGHVHKIIEHAGPLNDEEVYYPCPYPMVGGSCEPHTYSKGNVWVFLELVGQTHGIEPNSP